MGMMPLTLGLQYVASLFGAPLRNTYGQKTLIAVVCFVRVRKAFALWPRMPTVLAGSSTK